MDCCRARAILDGKNIGLNKNLRIDSELMYRNFGKIEEIKKQRYERRAERERTKIQIVNTRKGFEFQNGCEDPNEGVGVAKMGSR